MVTTSEVNILMQIQVKLWNIYFVPWVVESWWVWSEISYLPDGFFDLFGTYLWHPTSGSLQIYFSWGVVSQVVCGADFLFFHFPHNVGGVDMDGCLAYVDANVEAHEAFIQATLEEEQ